MKIALAQIDTVVGDLGGNTLRVKNATDRARAMGADLVVFPELTISGYDPRDLLQVPGFLESSQNAIVDLTKPASWNGGIAIVVGFPEPSRESHGAPAYNSCALLHEGRVRAVARKQLLPSYDVLEEPRYFEPATETTVANLGGLTLGLSICEDVWNSKRFHSRPRHARDPVKELVKAGADVIVNLSASPFHVGKPAYRERMLGALAAEHGVQVVMTNMVGGNDGLVFDGTSLAHAADGHTVLRCKSFEEDLVVFDTSAAEARKIDTSGSSDRDLRELHEALVLGIRDFCRKTGFSKVLVGLSGGMDSALVTTLAAEALGPNQVLAVAMPSRYSSEGSLTDARTLAANLGVELMEISIETPFSSLLEVLMPHVWTSSEEENACDGEIVDVAHENIQPRLRAIYLMALSNRLGHLVLAPGNKSEMAVGYSTIYGDMAGGLAPIGDVLKTTTYALAKRINERAETDLIPRSIIDKAPSAELRPEQRDQDTLPPYEVLDPIISAFVESSLDVDGIVAKGHDRKTARKVVDMIVAAEHKRRQAAPVIKVSPAPFGSGYRLPIVQRYR